MLVQLGDNVSESSNFQGTTKECGSCTACCQLMAIAELKKPHFTPCSHLCESGCSIYQDRPSTCRIYECLWKSNILSGGQNLRPDKLGVVFHPTEIGELKILELWETKPGAANSEKCQRLVKKLIQNNGFDDFQVIPAGQKPGSEMNMQLKFRKVDSQWIFQELVSLDLQESN